MDGNWADGAVGQGFVRFTSRPQFYPSDTHFTLPFVTDVWPETP
jgi:hypothetical protein